MRIFRALCFQIYLFCFSALSRICLNESHPCASCVQMAAPPFMVFDENQRAHSACLHWEGFPSILWDVMCNAGYIRPLRDVGEEFQEMGVARCRVHLTHEPHPVHAHWVSLELEAVGHRLQDTWELAAMRALTRFCTANYSAIMIAPIGLFPIWMHTDYNCRVGSGIEVTL